MPNLLERVEELHRRVTELEHHPARLGSSEKHIDGRVEQLEKLQRDTTEDMLDFHDRLKELEQRVPKPIPVVEPLAERVIRDAHEACGESPVFVEPYAGLSGATLMRHQIKNGQKALEAWKERAERAEGKLSDAHGLAVELRSVFASGRDVDSLNLAHNLVDFLARARVAKAGP